jgi:hypothetical protein
MMSLPKVIQQFLLRTFGLFALWIILPGVPPLASASESLPVKLILSVDWEGFSLEDHNLNAMKRFRDEHPEIKLVHFLNAAYFTKTGAKAAVIREQIRSVLRPGDELGLHIHAFESLLRASDVPFRDDLSFWGNSKSKKIKGDPGHDVPLSLFTVDEVRRMIRTSLQILGANGFTPITSFRAGGWIATPEVLEALRREGITTDSSAVSPELVGLVAGPEQPLYAINKKLWPLQTPLGHEPYLIETPAGAIQEFPDHIALADYLTGEQAFRYFDLLVTSNFNTQKPVFFHYGFHQETAATFLPEVSGLLKRIRVFAGQYRVSVHSETLSDLKREIEHKGLVEGRTCRASLTR